MIGEVGHSPSSKNINRMLEWGYDSGAYLDDDGVLRFFFKNSWSTMILCSRSCTGGVGLVRKPITVSFGFGTSHLDPVSPSVDGRAW